MVFGLRKTLCVYARKSESGGLDIPSPLAGLLLCQRLMVPTYTAKPGRAVSLLRMPDGPTEWLEFVSHEIGAGAND